MDVRTLPENAEEVRILNTENNTFYYFTLRTDRLSAFFQYLKENRSSGYPASTMPGISGPAMYALDCIFFGPKPSRFPAKDILDWLRSQQKEQLGGEYLNPTVTSQEIEAVLGQWAGTVSQLLADGSDRA
jgi:hypothetical protein